MSVQDISELFHHIVQSEEKIKQRFEELKKVNNAIKEHQEKIKCSKYDTDVLRGKTSTVNHKLIQEKIQKSWLENCKHILKDQLEKSLKEKEDLHVEIKEKTSSHRESRTKFLNDSDTLVKRYFKICFGDDFVHMKENWKEEYNLLCEEHGKMLKDIDVHENLLSRKQGLQDKFDHLKNEMGKKSRCREELINVLEDVQHDIKYLESTKQNLTKKVSTDPEFRNVLREMESSKDTCAARNKRHQDLTKELYELQRRVQFKNERRRDKQRGRGSAWSVSSRVDSSRENKGKRIFRYKKSGSDDPTCSSSDQRMDVNVSYQVGQFEFGDEGSSFNDDISLLPDGMFTSQDDDAVADVELI